jgi:hypothetical protein
MQVLVKAFYKLVIISIFFICYLPVHAQDFEGEVLYTKQTKSDTTFYSYKIKGNKVRFEELNENMQLDNYVIVDLSKKNVIAVNPKRKLYGEQPVYPRITKNDSLNFNIIRTGNYKIIQGIKCYQWRVQNKKEDTEISYWFALENFKFYDEFQKILNQSDKFSQYYLNISETHGFLPLEFVERSMLREWRMCLSVVKIEKKNLQASLFEIPAGYKMFSKN